MKGYMTQLIDNLHLVITVSVATLILTSMFYVLLCRAMLIQYIKYTTMLIFISV